MPDEALPESARSLLDKFSEKGEGDVSEMSVSSQLASPDGFDCDKSLHGKQKRKMTALDRASIGEGPFICDVFVEDDGDNDYGSRSAKCPA